MRRRQGSIVKPRSYQTKILVALTSFRITLGGNAKVFVELGYKDTCTSHPEASSDEEGWSSSGLSSNRFKALGKSRPSVFIAISAAASAESFVRVPSRQCSFSECHSKQKRTLRIWHRLWKYPVNFSLRSRKKIVGASLKKLTKGGRSRPQGLIE